MTQWSMKPLSEVGALKMDFLGLKTLTVIDDCLKLIEKTTGKKLTQAEIPIDDKKSYDLMTSAQNIGVFQLESVGMRNALRQLRPDRITDVIAMVALYRPGPMAEIPRFCQNKNDPSLITYLHPTLEPILKETYGVLVFQEQVMAIGRDVAGLSMVDSNNLLDALRKKKIDKMAKLEPYFLAGVKKTSGFSDEQAEQMWERLQEFAKYAFNKAHSACYALVAYQTAFLKANYPVEFMAALLTSVSDSQEKISLYIAESRKLGIEVLPPDVNASRHGFTIESNKIRFGMTAIKGVGAGAVDAIVAARTADGTFADLFDLCSRVESSLCNKLASEALIKAGAMDALPGNRAQKLAILDSAIEMGQTAARDKAVGQVSLFGDVAQSAVVMAPQLPPLDEFPSRQLLDMEREFLGLYISDHPLNSYADILNKHRTVSVEELAEAHAGDEVVIGGMLTGVKPYTTKNGKLMGFLSLDDLTGTLEITAFSDTYEKYGPHLKPDTIVLVKGTVDFGAGRATNSPTADEEEEKPEAKLLAIAIAPIEDAQAITELKQAAARRRGGPPYGNGKSNGRNQAPAAFSPPAYVAPARPSRPPVPDRVQEDDMPIYDDADAPPDDAMPIDAPVVTAPAAPPAPCRIRVTEDFVKSDDFEKLASLLQSCKGEAPVEIAVTTPGKPRRWRIADLRVNPARVGPFLKPLGLSLEE